MFEVQPADVELVSVSRVNSGELIQFNDGTGRLAIYIGNEPRANALLLDGPQTSVAWGEILPETVVRFKNLELSIAPLSDFRPGSSDARAELGCAAMLEGGALGVLAAFNPNRNHPGFELCFFDLLNAQMRKSVSSSHFAVLPKWALLGRFRAAGDPRPVVRLYDNTRWSGGDFKGTGLAGIDDWV